MTKEATARNSRIKAERHAKRMEAQAAKRIDMAHGLPEQGYRSDLKVPRGTARALRRAPLRVMYAKRQAAKDAS